MEVLHPRCAGLDVHKDTVVACARIVSPSGVEHHVQTFGTTTRALLELADWLTGFEVTIVAMEATGVYWRPIWHILEGQFELVLGNAAHIKNVPGRKTDVNDAMWLSDLLAHGLIRPSFVPDADTQQMRTLTRTRKQFVRERTRHVQRIQKTLEDANIKLASVVSDILGMSGRLMLRALIEGQTDPEALAALAQGKLKAKRTELIEALRGRVTDHHRFLLRLHLDQIDGINQAIAEIEARIGAALEPFRAAVELLKTVPGIQDATAEAILSEIGLDMSRFPTAGHLVSWAGLCPRNDESAGKRRSTRIRKSGNWLKPVLIQAAWAAVRKKGTYPRAQFFRIRARRGANKAIVAVAASLLRAIWHMLRTGEVYRDLGPDHFEHADRQHSARRLVRRLQNLGYDVEVKEAA